MGAWESEWKTPLDERRFPFGHLGLKPQAGKVAAGQGAEFRVAMRAVTVIGCGQVLRGPQPVRGGGIDHAGELGGVVADQPLIVCVRQSREQGAPQAG